MSKQRRIYRSKAFKKKVEKNSNEKFLDKTNYSCHRGRFPEVF